VSFIFGRAEGLFCDLCWYSQ